MKRTILAGLVFCGIASISNAESFTETFDGESNVGGWAISTQDLIEYSGGNPGAYLHAPYLDTGAPHPITTEMGSIFTGDYRARGVTSVSVDLITVAVEDLGNQPCAIFLREDNDTPWDWSDDWAAYKLGPEIPHPGDGWLPYEFAIPSQFESWPNGWGSGPLGPNSPPADWSTLMADVDELGFYFGDPAMGYIFQLWDVGLDNPTIVYDSAVSVNSRAWSDVKALFK